MTGAPRFRRVELALDGATLFPLMLEYMRWVVEGIAADPRTAAVVPPLEVTLEEYTAASMAPVCSHAPPEGAFYLVECEGEVAGMCGLRRIAPGVAEFKRIYLRPAFRGQGLGEAMLRRLLEDACAFGCTKAVLDTAPFMQAAQRRYRAAGFHDRAPYEGTEVPAAWHAAWCFMERALSPRVAEPARSP